MNGCAQQQATPAPRTSILKDSAEALRLLAARLDQFGADLPKKASEVIRMFAGGALLSAQGTVDLRSLGFPGYDARAQMVQEIGVRMGRTIAEKLHFSLLREQEYLNPFGRTHETYRGEVYVFTPGELNSLVEQAMKIGRESA